eukprot:2588093-Rhodomonas_salina.2
MSWAQLSAQRRTQRGGSTSTGLWTGDAGVDPTCLRGVEVPAVELPLAVGFRTRIRQTRWARVPPVESRNPLSARQQLALQGCAEVVLSGLVLRVPRRQPSQPRQTAQMAALGTLALCAKYPRGMRRRHLDDLPDARQRSAVPLRIFHHACTPPTLHHTSSLPSHSTILADALHTSPPSSSSLWN